MLWLILGIVLLAIAIAGGAIVHPVIFVLECLFLVVVTIHALLGVRSVLFDLGLSARAQRLVSRGLIALGVVTIVYGFLLVGILASRA